MSDTTLSNAPSTTVSVNRVYIKATAQAVWDAITRPDWNHKYGYGTVGDYDLRPGGAYRVHASEEMIAQGAPAVMIEGEVIEVDPPRKLVQTWHALFSPETVAEPATRLTWEIDTDPVRGITRLTVTHELTGAPLSAAYVRGDIEQAGGGWSFVLSDLKTLLETGAALSG